MKKAATCVCPVDSAADVCAALLAKPPAIYAITTAGCVIIVLSLALLALLYSRGPARTNKQQVTNIKIK